MGYIGLIRHISPIFFAGVGIFLSCWRSALRRADTVGGEKGRKGHKGQEGLGVFGVVGVMCCGILEDYGSLDGLAAGTWRIADTVGGEKGRI